MDSSIVELSGGVNGIFIIFNCKNKTFDFESDSAIDKKKTQL